MMKSWGVIARSWPLLLSLVAALPACGTSSTLYLNKPLEVQLDASQSATVVARGNGVKLSKAAGKLKEILARKLEKRGVFKHVGPDGKIRIQATIQNMDDGKEIGRNLTLSGEAKVTIEVKITKPDNTVLTHLTAQAESPREGDDDRPVVRVLEAAADEIVDYLASHVSKEKAAKKADDKPDKKADDKPDKKADDKPDKKADETEKKADDEADEKSED